jgi:hypothetical protein
MDSRRRRQAIWWAAVIVAVIARTVALGRWPGLNGDESWYGVNVQEWLSGGTPFFHTGVGNPLNPIHSGLLLLLSAVLPPSPALLRAPEVILGLLTVALAYPMLAKPLGERTALLTTVMLSVSTTAVAYSRLGWDPSGTPLFCLLAIGAALHDRPVAAVIATGIAYLVHPTNVFVAPVVLAAFAPHAMRRYRAASDTQRSRLIQAAVAGIVIAIPIGSWALIRIAGNPETPLPSIGMAIDRIVSPSLWLDRAWGAMGLLSGVTAAIDVSGPMTAAGLATGLATVMVLAAIVAGWNGVRSQPFVASLFAGTAASFAVFHIVAIPGAFQPGLERYALFLFVPLVIATASAVSAAIGASRVSGVAIAALGLVLMAAVLAGGYFMPLAARGGESAITYRTGHMEPKLAAFEFITRHSESSGPVTVIAENWWLYWSLRYFAGVDGRIHVAPAPSASIPGGVRPAGATGPQVPSPARTYAVAFAGSEWPATLTPSTAIFTAVDPIDRPLVQVFLLPEQDRP